ncbi:MAG TPA: hypothetical protein VD836_19060 [Solirubrobacteraceae bacterium]|nr:hypothetical protein [Solirubrobacteraceae bacterium]
MSTHRIAEGRLDAAATADARGMARCAHGEFESGRGELASYAIGWTTGAEERLGRITVGIGAGNPGGGTFHALVRAEPDGRHAYGLADEAFAEVPEGGPHLTAAEARAHDTLPFIWMVADFAMANDRRAWWMQHWLHGTPSIVTTPVFEQREPVLWVINDHDDPLWQLIGSTGAEDDQGHLGHLWHAIDEDPSLVDVLDLRSGEEAWRDRAGGPWKRRRSEDG